MDIIKSHSRVRQYIIIRSNNTFLSYMITMLKLIPRYHRSFLIRIPHLCRTSTFLIGWQSYTYIIIILYNMDKNQPIRSGELRHGLEVKEMRIPKTVNYHIILSSIYFVLLNWVNFFLLDNSETWVRKRTICVQFKLLTNN